MVGERLNARAKDKHAKQSAPEEDPGERSLWEQLTNQSMRRNGYDGAENIMVTLVCTSFSL